MDERNYGSNGERINGRVCSSDLRALQDAVKESLREWRETGPHLFSDAPTAWWLRQNGYGHIAWAIRKMDPWTVESFYRFFTSLERSKPNVISESQDATLPLIETHLAGMAQSSRWPAAWKGAPSFQPDEGTGLMRRAHQAQIYQVIRRLIDEYEVTDIVTELTDTTTEEAVRAAVSRVADALNENMDAVLADTYLQTADRFFTFLLQSGITAYNPVKQETGDWMNDSPAMGVRAVQGLWEAAETPRDKVLVLGLCFWGFTLQELCTLRDDDIDVEVGRTDALFTRADGEVIVLPRGARPLAALRRESVERWNREGWLFPVDKGSHASAQQLRQQFEQLRDRASEYSLDTGCTPEAAITFYQSLARQAETDLRGRARSNNGTIMRDQPSGELAVHSKGHEFHITPERRHGHRYYFFKTQIEEILQF